MDISCRSESSKYKLGRLDKHEIGPESSGSIEVSNLLWSLHYTNYYIQSNNRFLTWVSPHILSFILNNKYKTPLHNYLIPLNALATLLVRASLCRRIVTTIFITFFSDYNHTEPDYQCQDLH